MGFADYFLIVWDFIHFAKVNGIGVGPGRGSAAGSLAAYALLRVRRGELVVTSSRLALAVTAGAPLPSMDDSWMVAVGFAAMPVAFVAFVALLLLAALWVLRDLRRVRA